MIQTLITDFLLRHRGPVNAMKTCSLLLFLGLGGLSTGCSHSMVRPPALTAGVAASTDSGESIVALPAQTPFDEHPKARAAYLEFFAIGYRLAASGDAPAGCLCGSEGTVEFYEATVSGFAAGKAAGSVALAEKQRQNPVPAPVTAGAPTSGPSSPQR
jgi:hypothetical protein